MRLTSHSAGHLCLLAGLAGFVVWFTLDAWRAQPDVVNMLLAGPIAALTLTLIAAIAVGVLRRHGPDETEPYDRSALSFRSRFGVPAGCALLGLYVLSLEYVGFDAASFLFCALTMIFMGKRNWLLIVGYSALMSLGPVYVLIHVMGVPVTTLLLG
ncbi:MAG: tripartite tricarboxylate transporter TctB family protein [Paracoccus sp. (in: a-proteobacteria)]|uniref:tripartite tricarboxylate transporter TctB family protein n=1 Tax=Paracoccus sp. TaxID=267 RepID=UPI002E85AB3F|nr:tripartite tricarboxylate transporter TctB family protein [Pseudomonadota bacterium]